jgi:predicted nucleic acid-binding protein
MTNKILLDKNIVLDLVLGRQRSPKIIEILYNFDQIFISTHTFATCFYILRKSYSKEEVYFHLSKFELLEIDKNDCHLAFSMAQNLDDIEDCLEICTAQRNNAKILTADQKMVKEYNNFKNVVMI